MILSKIRGSDIYALVISLIGLIVFINTNHLNFDYSTNKWVTIFALVGATLLLYYFMILLPPTGNALSMDSAIYLASLFVFGVHLTLNLLLISAVIYAFIEGYSLWWKHVLNFAIYVLMIVVSNEVFIHLGGQVGHIVSANLMTYVMTLAVYFALNVLLIGLYFHFENNDSIFILFQGAVGETIASYSITLVLSIILSILLVNTHVFGLTLFVSVSVLLSYAFKQYFELYKEVDKKATIDQLTGLFNHGTFKEILEEKIKEAKSNQSIFSLAILDLDDFKKYNDYYGHLKGDELLKNFGNLLTEGCLENDVIARYGGEEFVIIMQHKTKQEAFHFLNRLRKSINDTYFEGVEVFPHGCLSFSAGITEYDQEIYDSTMLLSHADDAMYHAKNQGKNNIHVFDGGEDSNRHYNNIDKDMEILEEQLKFFLSKDVGTYRHSRRVFDYAMTFKDYMKITEREKKIFVLGALIHDIGKIEIPREVIQKKGKLTAEEWEMVKMHVTWGKEIVSVHKGLHDLIPLVELHHERYDGHGYPYGLKGKEIPKLARALCVIDSFDAMTTERPYQRTKTYEEGIQELFDCSGKQFDPQFVSDFAKMFNTHFRQDSYEESTK